MGMTFVALGVAFGFSYNFGSVVAPMRASLGLSAGQAGWVFSVFPFTFLALSGVTGRLADRYGPRPMLAVGGLVLAAGLGLTATAGHVATAVAGYLVVGVGVSCAYVPSVANVGAWFVRHRVQAIGIAVTGIGAGTVLGPIVTAALVDALGWRRTEAWLGLAAMVVLLACAAAMPVAARRRHADATWTAGRLAGDPMFRTLYASGFAMGLVLYVPFVFVAPMAEQGGVTPIRAAALISVIGFASTAARILFGLVAGRVGVVTAYKATTVTIWASFLIWVPSRSYWVLLVFALVFGAGYGGNIALMPAMLGHYYGIDSLGTVTGVMFTSASVGALFGAPLAGLLIGASGGYLLPAVVTFAVATLGTAGQVFLPKVHRSGTP
ncbi:MFS transporter [Virgisporangium aurantiacum]|uniref:MFS transporter n=1 Tax=Virgisporangium aurantiacum TaxID=175570 RepID=A0A8J4E576_9ACTN|nr:MFS transporter [Virgisporangium aurantiacum]